MDKNNNKHDLCVRLLAAALAAIVTFLLAGALVAHAQILGATTQEAVKEFWGQKASDWFDQTLMHENTKLFVALMAAVTLIGFMAVSAVLHMRTRDSLEKKIEDEANEIKSFQQYVTQRLLEGISDQMKKDVFQTISQGQAALWKPKE